MTRFAKTRYFLSLIFVLAWGVLNSKGWAQEREGRSDVYNTEPSNVPRQSPEDTVLHSRLPKGFRIQVAAKAPDIQQPIAMSWDAKGRLWVVENYTYAESKIQFDKNLVDRILIFQDTDSDGVFDHRKIFWDQGKKITSIQWAPNGIWVLAPPVLMFVADQDQDDKPDGQPTTVLQGFNEQTVRHNIANGLRWGPDGWLYGRHGILADSIVGRPGTDIATWKRFNCGIWRYSPTTHEVDVVCQGTTNPWGMDWDENGHLFFINTVIGHLWHAIPGSHLERMYGEDSDPTVFELMPMIADHWHFDRGKEDWRALRTAPASQATDALGGGHAHSGAMIYQADHFPAEYRNRLFTINFHGRRINQERLEPNGAGYVGKHEPDFVHFSDPWFRGIDLSQASDGSVYVLDWSDTGECHDADGVHRTSGTIYRISYDEGPTPKRPTDLAKLSTVDLIALCLGEDVWHSRMARMIVSHRIQSPSEYRTEVVKDLIGTFAKSASPREQLQIFWTLRTCDALELTTIQQALDSNNEHLRIAGLMALADHNIQDRSLRLDHRLAELARAEKSGLVLSYLAGLIPRLEQRNLVSEATIQTLVSRTEFLAAETYPRLLWYALKDSRHQNRIDWSVQYSRDSHPKKLVQFASRKAALEIAKSPSCLDRIFEQAIHNKPMRGDVIVGASEGVMGRKRLEMPAHWKELRNTVVSETQDPDLLAHVTRLDTVFGSGLSPEELEKVILDTQASAVARCAALLSLADSTGGSQRALDLAIQLVDHPSISLTASNVVTRFAQTDLIRGQLKKLRESHDANLIQHWITGLASRRERIPLLLDSVENGDISPADVSVEVRRQIQLADVPEWRDRLKSLWPEQGDVESAIQTRIDQIESMIANSSLIPGKPSQGRKLWIKNCASCHKLFGEGGSIGPDITGGQRNNLRYLTENILNPSAVVAANYRVNLFELDDGSIITGVVLNQTDDSISVQTTKEKIVLQKDEIVRQKPSALSLMPEGLLSQFSDQQIRDLFAYLQSETQVNE